MEEIFAGRTMSRTAQRLHPDGGKRTELGVEKQPYALRTKRLKSPSSSPRLLILINLRVLPILLKVQMNILIKHEFVNRYHAE